MAEQPGLSDQYGRASPWPLFVALGLVLSEAGVLFGTAPVAVGGLVLFGGSVVGILRESGYARTLWRPTLAVGAVFLALGGAVLAFTAADDRGLYVAGTGAVAVVAAVALWLAETGRV